MTERIFTSQTAGPIVLGVDLPMGTVRVQVLDSLTTAQSVAYREARRLGVPTAARDRFLDNDQNVDKISHQIERVVQLAKRQGHAIAICHPHPQTIAALEREAPYLKNAGVALVPVSQLVK